MNSSKAPPAFATDIDAFIAFLDLERGLSPHTRSGYQSDLDQGAAFLARRAAADWRRVTGAQAAAWLQALSRGDFAAASLARKLTALRMLARFLVRENLRADDFTALLAGPKFTPRLPATLSAAEVASLLAAPAGGDARA